VATTPAPPTEVGMSPCWMARSNRLARSSARAIRSRTMRRSLTALETLVSIQVMISLISARSAGAACTKTVLMLSS
jgi:hypothetical protein